MSRIRSMKPECFRHEELCELESKHPEARIYATFLGLMTQSDKAGRFEWKPRTLHLDVLPFVDYDLERTMDMLVEHGFLTKYVVGRKTYGCYPTWIKHQRPHKQEPPSVIPPQPDCHQTFSDSIPNAVEGPDSGTSPTDDAPQPSSDPERREMRQEGEGEGEMRQEAGAGKGSASAAAPAWMIAEMQEIGLASSQIDDLWLRLGLDGLRGALAKLRTKDTKKPAGLLLSKAEELAQEGQTLLEKNLKRARAQCPESPYDTGWGNLPAVVRDDLEVYAAWLIFQAALAQESTASEEALLDIRTLTHRAEDVFRGLLVTRHPDGQKLAQDVETAARDAPGSLKSHYRRSAFLKVFGLSPLKPASRGL